MLQKPAWLQYNIPIIHILTVHNEFKHFHDNSAAFTCCWASDTMWLLIYQFKENPNQPKWGRWGMEPDPVKISSLQTIQTAACYLFITSCCYEEIAGRRERNHNKDFANVGVQSYHYSRRWCMNDVGFEVGYLPIDARTQSQWQRNSLIPWARETVKNTPKKKNRSANSGQKQHHKYQMLDST